MNTTVIKHYFEITVHPTDEEVTTTAAQQVTSKVKKWRFPWRINMLAIPRIQGTKYLPPPAESHTVFAPLDPATEFRCDHLARPLIRMLNVNRKLYQRYGPKYVKKLTKTLEISWNSIYNYYRKKLRDRHLKRLKRRQKLRDAKKPKGKELEKIENQRKENLNRMATPKKPFPPEKIPRKWKPLEELGPLCDRLAMPKEYVIVPPRKIGVVNPAALKYVITENILKLYHIPERLKGGVEGPDPWVVSEAAKHAICSPRMEKLAQPSFSAREAKKHDEDKYDPWVIPKSTQTYKPTARILELAKPHERD